VQKPRLPYGWYIRVPDVPAFLRHIAPALEARLSRSTLAGHTGEVKINEYQSGLTMRWDKGKLVNAETWQPANGDEGHAGFPRLCSCNCSLPPRSGLRTFYPDCWARRATVLFGRCSQVLLV
jgi:hypothetical protein